MSESKINRKPCENTEAPILIGYFPKLRLKQFNSMTKIKKSNISIYYLPKVEIFQYIIY